MYPKSPNQYSEYAYYKKCTRLLGHTVVSDELVKMRRDRVFFVLNTDT